MIDQQAEFELGVVTVVITNDAEPDEHTDTNPEPTDETEERAD